MPVIRDMLFVNYIEKQIERRLTEEELSGEPFPARFPDGKVIWFTVPLLQFPYDLLSAPEVAICENLDSE